MVQRYQKLSNRATAGRFFAMSGMVPSSSVSKREFGPRGNEVPIFRTSVGCGFLVVFLAFCCMQLVHDNQYILLRNKFRRNKLGTRKARNPNEKTFT